MDVSTSVQIVNMCAHIITFSIISPYFLVNLQIFLSLLFCHSITIFPHTASEALFSQLSQLPPPLLSIEWLLFYFYSPDLNSFPFPPIFPLFSQTFHDHWFFFIHSLESFCFMLVYVMCRIIFRHTYRVECITQIIVCGNIIWPLCLCGKCYYTYVYYVSVFSLSHTQMFPIVAWLFVRGLADTGHKANTPLPHTNKPVTELRTYT